MFPLPKPYVFGENEWKEKYLGNEKFAPETFKLSFLEDITTLHFLKKKTNFEIGILGTKILMNQ